ncbi:hypothetical protein [Pseudomonas sp. NA-150]|uniref:hypothetical protein n=1 Tax=Pseudomonas sp. NA-150 TaxID=3367525 RepID=UPI0037C80601
MQSGTGIKSTAQTLANILLLTCLVYIGGTWLFTPSAPNLDKLVLNYPIGEGGFIYGVRNNPGGSTVGYSYRYYVSKKLENEEIILSSLVRSIPFLITTDPAVKIEGTGSELAVLVKGQVYDFHSRTVVRHADDDGYTGINISIKADSEESL